MTILMNLEKFLKPGKNMVLELDDDVEYLVDDTAVEAVKRGDGLIKLVRLVDRKICAIELKRIERAILGKGIVDYLTKK